MTNSDDEGVRKTVLGVQIDTITAKHRRILTAFHAFADHLLALQGLLREASDDGSRGVRAGNRCAACGCDQVFVRRSLQALQHQEWS